MIPISLAANGFSQRLKTSQLLIFVLYEKSILIPDFNICSFLQSVSPTFGPRTIEDYVSSPTVFPLSIVHRRFRSLQAAFKGLNGREIHRQSDDEIFRQLAPLMGASPPTRLVLYTVDFVRDILSSCQFAVTSLYSALDEAKRVQIRSADLLQWFLKDNEASGHRASSSPHGSTATRSVLLRFSTTFIISTRFV